MTWSRYKIKFVNDIARDWGGKIETEANKQCTAPVESTYLEDISRCQALQEKVIKDTPGVLDRFKNQFFEFSQESIDKRYGFIKWWDDSIFREYVDKLQHTCNRTEGEKKFTCNPFFRKPEGTCGFKWDCGM